MSEFILGQGLGHELEMAIGRMGGVTTDVQWLRTGSNFENVILLARNRAKLVRLEEAKPQVIDPIVRVDRSVRPVYPDFLNQEYINKQEFVALEKLGPSEFDASKLRKWWHPKQKKKLVVGNVIHEFLKAKKFLPSCLGFTDLLGIQAKGIEFFRQHFRGQAVYGWRSVVPDRGGDFRVPYLVEGGGEVVLFWSWLDNDWGASSPALRFATLFVSLPESCSGRVFHTMKEIDFSRIKTVHFIGIGGIGTSAIARMFLLEGKKVSGSDVAESDVTEELRKLGARIFIVQRAENIPADCDLVIYTIAVTPDNPEFAEAKKRGISMLSYPGALGIISKEKYTIAITGTHGKTTTTAMVAKILIDARLDPTVIVGSFLLDAKGGRTNFIAGKGRYLVVEGCEYRRSFLNLSPRILVILNIDADHLDYYKDLDDIKSAFVELTAKLPKDGIIIGHPMFEVPNIGCPDFPLDFKLKIPGKHNLENAKAALAVARALKISDAKAIASLSAFSGTWRRFEYRGKAENGALVYDDYGHHPTEIEATLQGAREVFPTQKIVVVFQPHLYSRTKDHLASFGACFARADAVILLPIYAVREKDPGNISSEMVVDEIKKNSKDAHFTETFASAATLAEKLSGAGDLILTLGAGETNKVADILVRK